MRRSRPCVRSSRPKWALPRPWPRLYASDIACLLGAFLADDPPFRSRSRARVRPEGSDVSQSLANTLDLARHAERLGYNRYWLAEHHNMPGIASAATAVCIAHVAAATKTIRVGAGGIMLPNHAPLVIAEQFGTLAALHPGRIDLGLGRAPGTDMATARALRRNLDAGVDSFPQRRGRTDGLFRAGGARAEGARRARRGTGGGGVDPRIEHLRRPVGGDARPALRLRLAFRAGRDGACARHLPLALPALAATARAACDAWPQRLCRRYGRRSTAAVFLAAAGLRQPAHGPPGRQAAAPRRRLRGRRSMDPMPRAMLDQALLRPSSARREDGAEAASTRSSAAPAPTS